jgi:leucyl aminopeptidase
MEKSGLSVILNTLKIPKHFGLLKNHSVLDKIFKQTHSTVDKERGGHMRIATQKSLDKKQDLLVIGIFKEDKDNLKDFNKDLSNELLAAGKRKSFSRKWDETHSTKISGQDVVVLGLGKEKEFNSERLRRALGKAVKIAKSRRVSSFSTNVVDLARETKNIDELNLGRAASEGIILSNYYFSKYLSKEKQDKHKGLNLSSLQWSGSGAVFGKGLKQGRVIAEATNFVKELVNEPAGVANSIFIEKAARRVAATSSRIGIKVLGETELKKLGMGSMLGVNAGSKNPPKLIILEYKGGGKERPTALVGKGITFDSGGYNLKPTRYIEDMHTDMAGSAAVLGTIKAAASLGLKKNLVGVMGMCENMVSHTAQHPGDIVKAFNGKTIMIGNTDAEGRLVLADALAYTQKKYNPSIMVDLATLTGACVVALGYYSAAGIGKDEKLLNELKEAGLASGDKVWPMPFFDDYQDWMDGQFSDLNNIAQKGKGYEAGSITAGVFLSKFIDLEKTRWAHLDIAGSAYWGVDNEYVQKGATGSGVRVLTYWLMGS